MHAYKVRYRENDAEKIDRIEAPGPGPAFVKCQKLHPGATMIRATRGRDAFTDYEPPPIQRNPVKEPRPFRVPKRDEKDGTMPFYDEVISYKDA